ncbi:unnamed protein product [Cylicocyclus nassatus]|uniref:Proteasome activator PA28 C-terminal domain-containing protein n=1 Tax=Cylicocyclus nassatus TaxID=53992 RepID=A0AA36GRF0_CYLNA|nr:unnamed protein product [Cylicocyclus nassatus]
MKLPEFPSGNDERTTLLKNETLDTRRQPHFFALIDAGIDLLDQAVNQHDIDPFISPNRVVILQTRMPMYGFINGSVPCNAHLADLMDQVRPLLRDAVEHVNKVKMWITLLIPRIEDGNNFGVSIQEETLGEVRNVESEAASFLDQMSRYFTSRAKLLTKIAKYPHVDDYRRAILDMDEKQFINIRLVVLEMRNHFSTLYDIITKNIEKIKKPRNSNMDMLY